MKIYFLFFSCLTVKETKLICLRRTLTHRLIISSIKWSRSLLDNNCVHSSRNTPPFASFLLWTRWTREFFDVLLNSHSSSGSALQSYNFSVIWNDSRVKSVKIPIRKMILSSLSLSNNSYAKVPENYVTLSDTKIIRNFTWPGSVRVTNSANGRKRSLNLSLWWWSLNVICIAKRNALGLVSLSLRPWVVVTYEEPFETLLLFNKLEIKNPNEIPMPRKRSWSNLVMTEKVKVCTSDHLYTQSLQLTLNI